jgi:hypothetical protein
MHRQQIEITLGMAEGTREVSRGIDLTDSNAA